VVPLEIGLFTVKETVWFNIEQEGMEELEPEKRMHWGIYEMTNTIYGGNVK